MQQENLEIIQIVLYSAITIAGFTFFIFFLLIRLKKKHISIEKDINELKHNLEKNTLAAQLEIQEETLNRISKDIHDNISLSLTLAKLYLNNLVPSEKDKDDKGTLSSCIDLISKSLTDLNDLSKSIDGEIIKKYGLIEAVEREIIYIRKLGNQDVGMKIFGETKYLNWQIELMIFRIIQESIRNAINHSKCKNIFISLNYRKSHLNVMVKDNGIGFDINNREHKKHISSGINNMINRSKLINAKLNILSKKNGGAIISIETPY
jgi:two-component system NarL family sensor kinase